MVPGSSIRLYAVAWKISDSALCRSLLAIVFLDARRSAFFVDCKSPKWYSVRHRFVDCLAIIFMWQLNQLEDVSTPIGRQLWFKPSLIVALIILYQIGHTMTWLIIYYHFNPDRVKALIPEGFKGFHHKTDHEII